MEFQTRIDGIVAGQPFEADNADAALEQACLRYDAMLVEGQGIDAPLTPQALTAHGEVVTVEAVRRTYWLEYGIVAGSEDEARQLLLEMLLVQSGLPPLPGGGTQADFDAGERNE